MILENQVGLTHPMVSVVIPIYNEVRWIPRLHNSLINNGYPKKQLEIIYVDGGSDDGSVAAIRELLQNSKAVAVRLLFNPDRIVSRSLNIGISEAQGIVILRADAHAWYEPNYIETSVRLLITNPSLGGVGGQAKAVGSGSFWSASIALAMNSLSGNGGVAYRIGESARFTDTIWCGCWWKKTLCDVGGFNESFSTNQDYELNFRLRDSGMPLLYEPSIRANYICRESLIQLWRQYYRYGKGRAHTLSIHPRSLQYRQLMALMPFTALIFSLVTSLRWPNFSLSILSMYLLVLILSAIRMVINKENMLKSFAMVPSLLVMHMSWGAGFSIGIAKHIFSASTQLLPRGYK